MWSMNDFDPASLLAALFAGAFIYLIVFGGMIALSIWIWYTITWRAIRRGLHEFHHTGCPEKLHRR